MYNIIDKNMESLYLRRQDYQSCTLGSNIDYRHNQLLWWFYFNYKRVMGFY